MRGYDEKIIDEIKSKNDLVSVISSYMPLEQRGRSFWGRCPFHHEKTPSFCVNGTDNFYYCFGCHKSGDVISFVMEIEGIDFSDAVKLLAQKAGITLPERGENDENVRRSKEKKEKLYAILKDAAHFYYNYLKSGDEAADKFLLYLGKRGVNGATVKKFGIGASPDFNALPAYLKRKGYAYEDMAEAGVVGEKNGRYYDALGGRLIIPVINQMNQVVAFCGRILEDKGFAKYVNTRETAVFSKGSTLFNINNLKKLKNEVGVKNAIMVEGHMDVVSLVAAGFENAVASMGTSLTKDQARLLKRYTDTVLISYDGDFAGQKAAVRGLEILKDEGLNVKVVTLPDGMDPDDVVQKQGKAAYEALLESAKPLIDFKLDVLKRTYDIGDTEGKRKFVAEAMKVVRESPAAAEREDLLKEIRSMTGITYESLKRDLENAEQPAPVKAEIAPIEAKEKNLQAERYVLASLLFSKKYAENFQLGEVRFTHPVHAEIYDYLAECKKEGKTPKPNVLYDIVEGEDRAELSAVLALELTERRDYDEARYFDDCVKTLKRGNLEREIETLTKLSESETDIERRKELVKRLMESVSALNRL
ncbi:MAG: DNA primase [Bacillota bacterium]|nr:MAG: DNA primase [Bacillota bacterium]